MFLKNLLSTQSAPWVMTLCFVTYTILSWILLFRDKRALTGIEKFYPDTIPFLSSSQNYLLHHGLNTIPTFLFALVSLVAIIYYFKLLTTKLSLKKVILFAFVFQLITLLSYPILSTDIFSYINSERVATVHHQNIWKVKPATFPNDKFAGMADWKDTTSVYGGVNFGLYYLPALLAQNNLLLSIIFYKIIPAFFGWASMYVLYHLLRLQKNIPVEKGMLLVFWNPLFVLEIFSSGHNDSMMIFFTLASLYLYKRELWLFAGIILTFAVQVKLIPIVLFGFCLLSLLRKRAFLPGLIYFAGFFSANTLIFSFMQVSIFDFFQRVIYNGGIYWQSLPNLIRYFSPEAAKLVTVGFIVWLALFIIAKWKNQQDPIASYSAVILVYLLLVSAAYWNWYVLWLLPFVPMLSERKISWTILIFTCTSLFAYPLLWLSFRFGYQSPIWPVVTYLWIFGVPIASYLMFQYRVTLSNKILHRFGLQKVFAEKATHSV